MTLTVDPYPLIADGIKLIIDSEFATEGYSAKHDHLHESLGHDKTRIGISPDSQSPQGGNMLVQDTEVLIQFYGKYDLKVDPNQSVDPRKITSYAHRLRTALQRASIGADDAFWYLNLVTTDYPKDPTGNMTRFEMRVTAKGYNSGLLETS